MPQVRIDERLWRAASPLRRAEWRTLITDMHRIGYPFAALLSDRTAWIVVSSDETGFRFVASAEPPLEFHVERGDLVRLIEEYVAIIRRISDDSLHESQMETLDMAKKVVHDEGGKRIGQLLPQLSEELELLRRVFSLLVSLAVDTTLLRRAHGHR